MSLTDIKYICLYIWHSPFLIELSSSSKNSRWQKRVLVIMMMTLMINILPTVFYPNWHWYFQKKWFFTLSLFCLLYDHNGKNLYDTWLIHWYFQIRPWHILKMILIVVLTSWFSEAVDCYESSSFSFPDLWMNKIFDFGQGGRTACPSTILVHMRSIYACNCSKQVLKEPFPNPVAPGPLWCF